jgi:hypothetical protein
MARKNPAGSETKKMPQLLPIREFPELWLLVMVNSQETRLRVSGSAGAKRP